MTTNSNIYNFILIWGRLVRVANLLIVVLTLFLLRSQTLSAGANLDSYSFSLLVLGTVMIAAGGNIINDILDYTIDAINKPDQLIIGRYVSITFAFWVYFALNFLSLIIGVYLANVAIACFFCGAIILLFLYSKYWKKQPVVGNLVVALLCAWVIVEFWYIEYDKINPYWQVILGFYTSFAFLTTWIREIIKDLEDRRGDLAANCLTMPIWIGEKNTLYFIRLLLLLLLTLLMGEIYFFYSNNGIFSSIYTLFLLVLPLIYGAYNLTIFPFSVLSNYAKVYMLFGLLLLLI